MTRAKGDGVKVFLRLDPSVYRVLEDERIARGLKSVQDVIRLWLYERVRVTGGV